MIHSSLPSAGETTKNTRLDATDALIFGKANNPVDIDEVIFTQYLSERYGLVCVNEDFYRSNGKVNDNLVRSLIQRTIEPFFKTNLDYRAGKLLKAAKNNLRRPVPRPVENVIHVKNGTVTIAANKIEFTKEKEFTLNELNVFYDPSATDCHVWLDTFLSGLLIEEDILTLQEFCGYAMSPTLRGETLLFILGVKGGEGKSRIGFLLKEIFGDSCFYGGRLGDLQENRFSAAVLENRLLFIDDDLKNEKLKDVKYIASVTTTPYQKSEPKGENQREFYNYCRLMAFGNTALSTLYDKSDALPRRMLLLKTKPKEPNRVDDKQLIDKLIVEKEAIFNWMIAGLKRLLKNGYNFTISKRAHGAISELQDEGDNIRGFLRDNSIVLITNNPKDCESTIDLYDAYNSWCNIELEKPTTSKAFASYLKTFSEHLGIEYKDKLPIIKRRGYRGIKLVKRGVK